MGTSVIFEINSQNRWNIIIHRVPVSKFSFVCKNNKHLASINLGPVTSIVGFIVGSMNTFPERPYLAHEVLVFAPLRLKGVACEATRLLEHKINGCQSSLGTNFCVGAYKRGSGVAQMT